MGKCRKYGPRVEFCQRVVVARVIIAKKKKVTLFFFFLLNTKPLKSTERANDVSKRNHVDDRIPNILHPQNLGREILSRKQK